MGIARWNENGDGDDELFKLALFAESSRIRTPGKSDGDFLLYKIQEVCHHTPNTRSDVDVFLLCEFQTAL